MTTFRIVLLDDQQLFLDVFSRALAQEASDIELAGSTTDVRRAYELVDSSAADLLVSDLLLRDTDAVAVAWELSRRRASTGLVVLTMQSNRAFVREALQAGARGYVLKSQPIGDVISALRTAAEGQRYLAPSLEDVSYAPQAAAKQPGTDRVLGVLSRREQEIFCRIIYGSRTREIAQALSISVKTVETHRTHINRKLDVHSPADLIRVAAMAGLLREGKGPSAPMALGQLPAA
jgi:DNA-binding NarL/FixJ family response regulator